MAKNKGSDRGLDFDRLVHEDEERKRRRAEEQRVISLRKYVDLVRKDPLLTQNSPSRLLEVVRSYGVESVPEEERWMGAKKRFPLFSSDLYGLDAATSQVVEHIENGAAGASSGKYILLLVGPTSSGKSTFADILKQALQRYRIRPVFCIQGCPIREEPLNALPRGMTSRDFQPDEYPALEGRPVEEHLGISPIEGDLCPECRYKLAQDYTEEDGTIRWQDLPVESFTFSIQGVRGIGVFVGTGEITEDRSKLIGRENIQITQTKGYNHPKAFDLSSGEVQKANRGILEGEEMIKADPKMLRVFVSLAEEKRIKVEGVPFPMLYIDTRILGHCNLKEFREFSADEGNAALHDRMYVVPFPYTLRVQDEIRIYEKLIERDSRYIQLKNVHIPEATYKLAATFAILTRLHDSPKYGISPIDKMRAYNGEKILVDSQDQERRPIDVRALREEWSNPEVPIEQREGMFGTSYRDTLAALNTAIAQQDTDSCVTPLTAIKALREVFDHRMGYSQEDIGRFRELLSAGEGGTVMQEWREFVKKTLTEAFLSAYGDMKQAMRRKYIDECRLYRSQHRKMVRKQVLEIERDPVTGEPREPDLDFLRSVEKHMEVSESQADAHRGELLEFLGENSEAEYEELDEAIESKLVEDNATNIVYLLDETRPKSEEEKKRSADLFDSLKSMGYCPTCRQEICRYGYEELKKA